MVVVQRVEYATSFLWEKIDSSTLGVVRKTVWFLGIKCSSLLAATMVMAEKTVVVTSV